MGKLHNLTGKWLHLRDMDGNVVSLPPDGAAKLKVVTQGARCGGPKGNPSLFIRTVPLGEIENLPSYEGGRGDEYIVPLEVALVSYMRPDVFGVVEVNGLMELVRAPSCGAQQAYLSAGFPR